MTCSQLIVNWLLGSVSENVPPLCNLSSKEVKHINNSMRMWNMMKCFMPEVKRVSIDKVFWKAKMKNWDYMSAINVWDNGQNDFNIKYMANNKPKKLKENILQSHFIFKSLSESKECTLKKSIIDNHSQ